MLNNLREEDMVSEGGLIELSEIQKDLLGKRRSESYDDEENMKFTKSFLECNDILLGSKPSWNQMTTDQGYDVTSRIVESSRCSGDCYVETYKNETKEDMEFRGNMTYTYIKMNIEPNADYCFPFECSNLNSEYHDDVEFTRAMIRIPAAVFQLISKNNKSSVGTIYDMENGMMPNYVGDKSSEFENDTILFQTTLDFELVGTKVENLSIENEIEITFKLEDNQVTWCFFCFIFCKLSHILISF